MDSCIAAATPLGLQKFLAFTESWLSKADIGTEAQYNILIIVEELAVNIVNYAYNKVPGQMGLTLEHLKDTSLLKLSFWDRGQPFNPLAWNDPELSESAEDRPIGGLGIFMVKSLADKFEYEYSDKQNKITIEKRLA